MHDEFKKAHQLIPDIYDCALDPGKIPEVLHETSEFVGAFGALITEIIDTDNGPTFRMPHMSLAYNEVVAREYIEKYSQYELEDQEVFQHYSLRSDDIELVSDEMLARDRKKLEQKPNVQYLKSIGIEYRAAAILNKDLVKVDRFAFQFGKKQGPFNQDHARRANLVLPHLSKALNIGRPAIQLAKENRAIIECLDQLKNGVCVVDEHKRVVVKNLEFTRQLEAYNVFNISHAGELEFDNQGAMKSAAQMFSSIGFHGRFGARPRKEAIEVGTNTPLHELCIEIAPLGKAIDLDKNFANGNVIFSLDTSKHSDIDLDKMGQLYSLTHSEQLALGLVAEGLTNPQIAESFGKSVETINSQVKSILSKTVSSNRTQLIRLASQINSQLIG